MVYLELYGKDVASVARNSIQICNTVESHIVTTPKLRPKFQQKEAMVRRFFIFLKLKLRFYHYSNYQTIYNEIHAATIEFGVRQDLNKSSFVQIGLSLNTNLYNSLKELVLHLSLLIFFFRSNQITQFSNACLLEAFLWLKSPWDCPLILGLVYVRTIDAINRGILLYLLYIAQ